MLTLMAIIGSVVIAAAVLVHLFFFAMESVLWSSPSVWRRFGVASQSDADVVRPMAYNQGFYNLFLAGGAAVVLAALVLLTTGRRYLRAALLQGVLPLVGLVLLAIG
jgi:putative membrane protein